MSHFNGLNYSNEYYNNYNLNNSEYDFGSSSANGSYNDNLAQQTRLPIKTVRYIKQQLN